MAAESEDEKSGAKPPKLIEVVINGRARTVESRVYTLEELSKIAFPDTIDGPDISYSATYRKAHGEKPKGTLAEGESVRTKKGMIINVTRTDKS